MTTNFLAASGLLLLGWIIGRDGKPTGEMVVCPAPNGKALDMVRIPGPQALPGQMPQVAAGEVLALEPISDRLLDNFRPVSASTTYYLTKLLDTRFAQRVLILINNTTNQALTIQTVGHVSDNPQEASGLNNIGGTQSIAATNGRLGIGVDLSTDWYPYLGVTIATGGTAPTTGWVSVYAYGQRWAVRRAA